MINLYGKIFLGFWLCMLAIAGSWIIANQYSEDFPGQSEAAEGPARVDPRGEPRGEPFPPPADHRGNHQEAESHPQLDLPARHPGRGCGWPA